MIEHFAYTTLVALGIMSVVFIGPLIAVPLLVRRKRRDRAARKSPLTENLLRAPGHTLRQEMEELRLDFVMDLVLLMFVPTFLLALYLSGLLTTGFGNPRVMAGLFVLCGIAGLVYLARKLHRTSLRIDILRKGLDAEMAVGQELDQLMRQGAAVFHDFPAEQFNIDHVVIAPQGVFAVESKGYTKRIDPLGPTAAEVEFDGKVLRFGAWATSKPLEQTDRQALWLAKWLASATGNPTPVTPVLALPGWYVNRKGRGPVRVFSGKELSSLLRAGAAGALSNERLQQVCHQVEQRCRTVKPFYRPHED